MTIEDLQEVLTEIRELKGLIRSNRLRVYSLNQASESFGVSNDFLKKGIESGDLKYVKNGNRTYITESALKEFFESNNEFL